MRKLFTSRGSADALLVDATGTGIVNEEWVSIPVCSLAWELVEGASEPWKSI